MKINVNWKDINNGIPYDPENCAVACALMRKFKTTDVRVYYDRLYCDNDRDEGELVLRVGTECYDKNYIDKEDLTLLDEFISDYDTDSQAVVPIKFNIDTTKTTI